MTLVPNASDNTQVEADASQLRRINERILRHLNVAVVLIDRSYRIVTINAAARRLLGIRELVYDQDFLHAVRGIPYHEVRRAIDTAMREHSTITLPELELNHSTNGSGRFVSITVMVMSVENSAPELAVLTVQDTTEQVQLKKRLETMQREHAELFAELTAANKRFGSMNKELQDANEELQAANEELMLTQEELQATNEEFEATNEELQATNEELEINNEELQATNEELTFRTAELQELARQNRLEQLQLSVPLERFPHYVMVLDADTLKIHAVNPAYEDLFADRNVQGLTIVDIFSGADVEKLIKLLRNVVEQKQSVKTEPMLAGAGNESGGERFVHTIVPITDANSSHVNRLFIYSEKVEHQGGGEC